MQQVSINPGRRNFFIQKQLGLVIIFKARLGWWLRNGRVYLLEFEQEVE
jgi:hypothetical protein